jgi:plastocyanin
VQLLFRSNEFSRVNKRMKTPLVLFLWISVGLNAASQGRVLAQQHDTTRIKTQTGSVNGRIEIMNNNTLEMSQPVSRHHAYGSMNMTSHTPVTTNEFANIVVYLEGQNVKRESLSTRTHSQIDQRNAEFIPHVLPVIRGTIVDFINRDNVYHNVFSLSPAKKFNIGRRPTGQAVPIVMDKPGIVEVFCDIHANMSAYIVVLENEYFTKPDKQGNYSIDRIPSGTYTLKIWHERLSSTERTITISPNSTATINFVME